MHDSSYEKMDAFVRVHLAASRGRTLEILDFGSQTVDDQPRSYRDLFDDPAWRYRGLDIEPGANVDVVVTDPYEWTEVASDSVDVVISGQAFEHVEYFWASMFEIIRVLRPGGLAVIIAPSGGVEHRYPVDCWRFYRDGFSAVTNYVECDVIDVFTDWNRAVWADSVLVARKPRWNLEQRQRFRQRSRLQRLLLTTGPIDLTDRGNHSDDALPAESMLSDVDVGALTNALESIREEHLADEAAAAENAAAITAAQHESVTTGTAPSSFAVSYGRLRARIAGLVGPGGRSTYKRLRGRE